MLIPLAVVGYLLLRAAALARPDNPVNVFKVRNNRDEISRGRYDRIRDELLD